MESQKEILLIQQAIAKGSNELAETKLKLLYEQAITALKARKWELCEALLRDVRCVPVGNPVFDEYRGRANATIELLPLIQGTQHGRHYEIVTTEPKDETAPGLPAVPASSTPTPPPPSTPSGPRPPRSL